MSASAAIRSASPLPLGSSNKHDPALKPNPHPYAIKTTHTGILSRSNSSGHNTPSRYFYTPPTGTPSPSPTKPKPEYRGHRHSASLTGELPLPFPSPLASPAHSHRSQSEDDVSLRRQRADTLPTYLANIDDVSTEPEEDLPHNPKTWTPSQLSVYLTTALRVRSGARLPERVARDITSWVRREAVTGRAFLRWTDEDLKALGVNTLWRGALLTAARNLRQNMLRGRIWGTPTSEPEQEESPSLSYAFPASSPDLTLADANVDADTGRVRWNTNANGRVRGMVDKWERESASSRSSSRSSSHRRSESDGRSELGSDADIDTVPTTNDAVSPTPPLPFPSKDSAAVDDATEEPSIEDLLAAASASSGADGRLDLDIGTTMRRVDAVHDTVVPRRDGSGSGSSNGIGAGSVRSFGSRRNGGDGSNNGSQRARRTVVDIFADPVDVDPLSAATANAGVQVDARRPAEIEDGRAVEEEAEAGAEAELEARERALEDEMRGTRALLEEFRRRLEEVEARVGAMEQQQQQALNTHNDKAIEAVPEEPCVAPEFFDDPAPSLPLLLPEAITVPPTPTDETSASSDVSCTGDDADSERSVVSRPVGLGPETVSDLPSYVFLVGLGVCTVVLQVVLKRVAGRSLKP
ncbi:hypothetical protein BJY52DRAFT_1283141 [Lactarius psammicola]|nr:hypothetical protein BJY52DRAFT_1283141 [Lactarius psammicola]